MASMIGQGQCQGSAALAPAVPAAPPGSTQTHVSLSSSRSVELRRPAPRKPKTFVSDMGYSLIGRDYKTCRFSHDLDFESRCHTLSSRPRTLRLADMRLRRQRGPPGEPGGGSPTPRLPLVSSPTPTQVEVRPPTQETMRGDRERLLDRDALRLRKMLRVRSGSCSLSRICVRIPTRSSSTLWFMATDVSMNLQS